MAETYNRLNLDVNVKPCSIVTAVQKDSDSRYLDVFLYNNGVPVDLTGHEVRIYMRKPENGGEIFNGGEITEPENGRCQFLLTTAALEKTGHMQTQVSIWKDNREILSTQIFEIFVTESLRTTGSIEGSNEYGALVVLFQNLYESMDLMTDMVQNFGTAGAVAAGIPAGTFWQMLEAVYAVNKDALENASVSEVLNRIGLTGDTGGSQTAGTVMAKENAVLGMADIIYKVSCFQNVANLEQTTFSANFNLTYSYKTKPKTLLKNIVLERDLYLTSASLSVSNGNNGGHANAAFELALNGNMVLSANVGTSYNSSYFGNATCYYSDISGGWITSNAISGSIDYSRIPSQKFILCPKGSTISIYGSGTNNGTTGSSSNSITLKGYYLKK